MTEDACAFEPRRKPELNFSSCGPSQCDFGFNTLSDLQESLELRQICVFFPLKKMGYCVEFFADLYAAFRHIFPKAEPQNEPRASAVFVG